MPMKNPPHPGEILREDIIAAHGLTVTATAKQLGLSRTATLSDLLNGRASVSPEMALRFELAFGLDMEFLLRLQVAYDVAQQRKRAASLGIEKYEPAPKPRS